MPAPLQHHASQGFSIRLCRPASGSLDQDEESFEVEQGGQTRRLRIHDYAEIYKVPGLYEALVYEKLKCKSPKRAANLLANVLADWPEAMADLSVLDLGAGNGIMAEELRRLGVGQVIGLDLLPEAAMAAQRDRPEVYDDYVVADLTALTPEQRARLVKARCNCLVTVAALGFGDIPPEAFTTAFNLVATGGWIVMTIKEGFLDAEADDSGFARLVRSLIDEGTVEVQAHQRYCHRRSIRGERLFYVALVARKVSDLGRPQRDAGNGSIPHEKGGDPSALFLPGS